MRATHRYAVCVATLALAACGYSQVLAQGTALPPTKRPPATAPSGLGGAPTGAPAGGVRPASGATTSPRTGGVAPTAGTSTAAPAAATPSGGAARSGGAPTVVVIDIGEVFKKHAGFNQQVEAIKKEMKDLEAWVQTEQKKVVDARAKLADYAPQSPEYKKIEEEVTRMASDLQVAATLKQKGILEQEAKIYYGTYVEIYKQVEEFADRYGITLVLRHSNLQIDPAKRDSIFRGLERNIVFQRNLDITEEILSRVNRTASRPVGATGATGGAGAAPGKLR